MKKIRYALYLLLFLISCESGDGDTTLRTNPVGKGGSMARFALNGNHLYVIDNTSIHVFETGNDGALTKVNSIDVGFGIETIFVSNARLFLGASDAMFIYNIENPATPEYLSRYSHMVSCDPVVVNGQIAYVTLRVRNDCHSAGNDALEIINISDLTAPVLLRSYAVQTPYGLGVDDDILFLCEGDNGMQIYNVADPENIVLVKEYDNVNAYDVIPNNGLLIMTGRDGIFQYDYSDPSDIHLLSHIPI